jgi:hypothetical protein
MENLLENYLSQKLENPQFSLFIGWWTEPDLNRRPLARKAYFLSILNQLAAPLSMEE